MTQQTTPRLSPRPGELIERDSHFSFSFDGKTYRAYPGDTIASALAAAGVKVFSRSFKYHRPRGLMCCAGHCPNCLVQVGDEPNVRSCTRPVKPNMSIKAQNAWPSLKRDMMSLIRLGDRFLPVGFYYKAFIRPRFLWPTFERFLRHAAGLGKVNPDTPPGQYAKQYLHADLVVVGAGPAGLSAALAAAETGARVLLFDENSTLGGHQRFTPSGGGTLISELLEAVDRLPNLTVYPDTTVLSCFEGNWLSASNGSCLFKIRAHSIIFATGAYEQPLLFDNNDLPGVMLGSGVLRLLNLYRVTPGQRALVVSANDDGWIVAAELRAAGIEVAAIIDERQSTESPFVQQLIDGGTDVFWSHTIMSAAGSGAVSQAVVAPVDEHGQINPSAGRKILCDLIAVSVGWAPANGLLYQANARVAYDRQRAIFLPVSLPPGIFATGRLAGCHNLSDQLAGGRLAGKQAAAFLDLGDPPGNGELSQVNSARTTESRRTSSLVYVPGKKKQFLCFCEDVTKKDLDVSIAEGYDSIELLKRYSTISMGPCQGRMCSLNAIHLCARANGQTVEETGTTTSRPPLSPVSLGVLAGQNMEPVRVTPVHDWHTDHGAKMMIAGLWQRPEHYGDPLAEVQAVRRRVGLIDISTLGKLKLTGPGVPHLLERLYVNRWLKLEVGRVRYGLMCNDEGIVLDDGVTARVAPQEWYMTTTSSGASSIYEWIQWWLQSGWGEDVSVTDLSEVNAAFNLAGPKAREVLQKLTKADVTGGALSYMRLLDLNLAGVPCRLLRIGFTGELSFEIHCPAGFGQHVWDSVMAAGEPFGISPFGVEAQRILRLEKAHIIVGHDTDALTDPISADMAWAVKLDKADFLGQRSLMRIAKDGPQQRLVGYKLNKSDVIPEEGLQIVKTGPDHQLDIIGWVTSSRFSPTLGEGIGLCWLPADMAEKEGTSFMIRRNGSFIEAKVHHGPFYDPQAERLRM